MHHGWIFIIRFEHLSIPMRLGRSPVSMRYVPARDCVAGCLWWN